MESRFQTPIELDPRFENLQCLIYRARITKLGTCIYGTHNVGTI